MYAIIATGGKQYKVSEGDVIFIEKIDSETARTDEIKKLEEYKNTTEYVEEIAKDKLGLVYKDEIIFKPSN